MWLASYFGDFAGGSTNLVVTPGPASGRQPGRLDGHPPALLAASASACSTRTSTDHGRGEGERAEHLRRRRDPGRLDVVVPAPTCAATTRRAADNVKTAWITYTFGNAGCNCWRSVDLARDAADPNLWSGVARPAGGRWTRATSGSSSRAPTAPPSSASRTTPARTTRSATRPRRRHGDVQPPAGGRPPSSGPYGGSVGVSATLTSGLHAARGQDRRLPDRLLDRAPPRRTPTAWPSASLPLLTAPGTQQLAATFAGDADHLGKRGRPPRSP